MPAIAGAPFGGDAAAVGGDASAAAGGGGDGGEAGGPHDGDLSPVLGCVPQRYGTAASWRVLTDPDPETASLDHGVTALSADGSTIVGMVSWNEENSGPDIGFYWTDAEGMVGLPTMQPQAVSCDGSVFGGNDTHTGEPMRWTRTGSVMLPKGPTSTGTCSRSCNTTWTNSRCQRQSCPRRPASRTKNVRGRDYYH